MKRKIEKLIDQASIEEALSKMRNGVCLLLEDGVFNYIYELRKIDNLNGEKEEKIFAFDSKDHKFKDVYDLEWWGELHAEYVNAPHCTMSSDEALEILEKWKGRHNIFVFGLLPNDFNLKDEEKLRTRRNSITKSINKSLESISKKAQLGKKVTFHMARHSWAVSALEQGMQMNMISSLLGHTSIAITEKVYAEFRQGTKAEAVKKLKLFH